MANGDQTTGRHARTSHAWVFRSLGAWVFVASVSCAGETTIERVLGGRVYRLREVFEDSFQSQDNWLAETTGTVVAKNRRLLWDCSGKAGTIWCRQKFDGPTVVEFDAEALSGANNLNFILYVSHSPPGLLQTTQQRSGAYREYHQFPNYIVTYLTPDETRSKDHWRIRFRKNPGFNLLSERFLSREAPFDLEQRLTYVCDAAGGIRFFVNGELAHEHQEASPSYRSGFHGFRTWNSRVAFSNFKVYAIVEPAQPKVDLQEINPPLGPGSDQMVAIFGARLIDGRGGEPIENSTVLLRGATIEDAGPRGSIVIPEQAERIDATGMSVLPGLIDSHLHSINDLDIPARFLAHGVTAFRDPGHPFRFYQAVMQTDARMPRAFLTGAHLDAYPPIFPQQAIIVKDVEHAGRIVDQHVSRGASAIKIYFRLPLEHYKAICAAADHHKIPVTAHVELVDADAAIRAGVDGIEHVTSFGTALADPTTAAEFKRAVSSQPSSRRIHRYRLWASLDLENSARLGPLLELVVNQHVFVSPTLAVFERRPGDEGATEVHARGFANMLRFVGLCHEAGATIVVGSHTSVPHAEPGWAYQREMELLVEAGLSPLRAITAGTYNNARFFRIEDRLGSIERGKVADLVLVEGNPAEDIRAMYDVRRVMLNGVWMGRTEKD